MRLFWLSFDLPQKQRCFFNFPPLPPKFSFFSFPRNRHADLILLRFPSLFLCPPQFSVTAIEPHHRIVELRNPASSFSTTARRAEEQERRREKRERRGEGSANELMALTATVNRASICPRQSVRRHPSWKDNAPGLRVSAAPSSTVTRVECPELGGPYRGRSGRNKTVPSSHPRP